ncbi:beta-N-acetylglucosaminidase domain-containing protein [Kribbella pittospori]|uniref:beta-N-acetylglucosaminidase domain-containing protein n=1 Tax=Kribbella pittospori TaxID=722689 RepID=UPI0013F4036F|nr:beta-N-acetylglucosaminidase domain-containing protein [Kribbella pittospori]
MAIEDRVVLECFYGPLWTPADRAAVVRRAHSHGATGYVYGPAADGRTGADWREPYGDDAGHLAELLALTRELGMTATWRVSPGAPLCRDRAISLADRDELALLLDRVTAMTRLGFDRVIVAFDDIDAQLDPVTRAMYGADPHPMAAAQAVVINAIHDGLANLGTELLVCPTHYWGVESSRYRLRLGELLHPELIACWTGPTVVSPTVSAAQARTVAEQLQRRVWLWDNYPVNDWDGTDLAFSSATTPRRLPLAPLRGRDPRLADVLVGYGANAALQAHAGLPGLCTAMEWACDPQGYDPDRAFVQALEETGQVDALEALAGLAGPSVLTDDPGRLAVACWAALRSPDPAELVALHNLLDQSAAAIEALSGPIASELRPWADALRIVLPAASAAARVLTATRAGRLAANADITMVRDAIRSWPRLSIAGGALFALADHTLGTAGAGTPTWPDG